jgi:ribosomal protein S18 acetylase RimI-like enzyme
MPRVPPAPPTPNAARVRVRRATSADVDVVAPFFDAYRVFYGKASDLDAARRFLAARLQRRESVVLLAESGPSSVDNPRRALGFAQLYPSFSSVSLAPIVVLNDLFVAPKARRQGVAARLLDAAAAYARRSGAARLELATQRTNRPALALYRAKGFVADAEFAHLSLALDGARRSGRRR